MKRLRMDCFVMNKNMLRLVVFFNELPFSKVARYGSNLAMDSSIMNQKLC
jgi:hypothetical protein